MPKHSTPAAAKGLPKNKTKPHTCTELAALPYFGKDNKGWPDFWAVSGTGNSELDWALGRELGRVAVQYLRGSDWQFHLGQVVSAMVRRGDEKAIGVVLGFCESISRELMRCNGPFRIKPPVV